MKYMNHSVFLKIIIACSVLFYSCATQNLFQSKTSKYKGIDSTLVISKQHTHLIKPDDKINISIWNHDDLSVGSIFGIYNSNEVYGKWVLINKDGKTKLPKLGLIHLEGLTTGEAAEKLKTLYATYIKNPIIVIKVLNREVIILGEVLNPGTYLLEKEENTLFEIIGKAGGLNFYGDKKKVKFIRESKEHILDLTKMEDFELNNIIVQSGDLIYIPTKKGKMIDKKSPTLIPFTSIATTLAIIFSLFIN